MTGLVKVLVGVAAAGAVAATAYVVVKKVEEKKQQENPNPQEENTEKKETAIDKLKVKAQKKAIKIFAWIALHKDQIEGVAAVLGLFTAVLGVVNKTKEFATRSKINEKLDILIQDRADFKNAWNGTIDNYDKNFQEIKDNFGKVIKEGA